MSFFEKYKKIIFILVFIIIIFVLGYFLYSLFFKAQTPTTITEEKATTTTGGALPASPTGQGQVITPTGQTGITTGGNQIPQPSASQIANGGVTKTTQLNNTPSLGATLSKNGTGLNYYNEKDGLFYQIDKDGNASPLSDKIFYSVGKITWSPAKNKAILEYPDGANIVYDFETKKQVTLPAHWENFDFSPTGDKLVMKSIGLDVENRWLAVSNEDGTEAKKIEQIGKNAGTVYPSWSPNNQTVAMYTKGIDFDRQEVFFLGLNDENFKSTIIEGRGFQYKWAPKGDKLTYSVYSNQNDLKPMLWVVNAEGESIGSGRKSLNLETWAEKCTFASEVDLYCAVPENLEKGSGIFPELAKNTKDKLYKIDTRTGMKKLVAVPEGSFNMSNLIVSEGGKYLYFTDEKSKTLNKIDLK